MTYVKPYEINCARKLRLENAERRRQFWHLAFDSKVKRK